MAKRSSSEGFGKKYPEGPVPLRKDRGNFLDIPEKLKKFGKKYREAPIDMRRSASSTSGAPAIEAPFPKKPALFRRRTVASPKTEGFMHIKGLSPEISPPSTKPESQIPPAASARISEPESPPLATAHVSFSGRAPISMRRLSRQKESSPISFLVFSVLAVFVAVLLICVIYSLLRGTEVTPVVLSLVYSDGEPSIIKRGEKEWISMEPFSSARMGEYIGTQNIPHTVFMIDMENTLRFGPGTRIGIADLRRVKEENDITGRLEMLEGRMWVQGSAWRHVNIKTPMALIETQGSTVEIRLSGQGDTTLIAWNGAARFAPLENLEQVVVVNEGEESTITAQRTISQPHSVSAESGDSWQTWNRDVKIKDLLAGEVSPSSASQTEVEQEGRKVVKAQGNEKQEKAEPGDRLQGQFMQPGQGGQQGRQLAYSGTQKSSSGTQSGYPKYSGSAYPMGQPPNLQPHQPFQGQKGQYQGNFSRPSPSPFVPKVEPNVPGKSSSSAIETSGGAFVPSPVSSLDAPRGYTKGPRDGVGSSPPPGYSVGSDPTTGTGLHSKVTTAPGYSAGSPLKGPDATQEWTYGARNKKTGADLYYRVTNVVGMNSVNVYVEIENRTQVPAPGTVVSITFHNYFGDLMSADNMTIGTIAPGGKGYASFFYGRTIGTQVEYYLKVVFTDAEVVNIYKYTIPLQ